MAEADIPKRVVIVLLFLVILISFLGTLTVLQLYATSPRPYDVDASKAVVSLSLLPPLTQEPARQISDDTSTISIQIAN